MNVDRRRVNMSDHDVAIAGISKRKRKLAAEDLIDSIVVGKEDCKKESPDDAVVKEPPAKCDNGVKREGNPSKRRKRFISVKEFNNQLALDSPTMEWSALKKDCIYKLCDLDTLGKHIVTVLKDEKDHMYVVHISSIVLTMVQDKVTSYAAKDKDVEIYLRSKDDDQVDIVVKEIFPCRKGCNEEFYSKSGRWLHYKHCMEKVI